MASKRIYDGSRVSKAKDPVPAKRTRQRENESSDQSNLDSWRSTYFEETNDSNVDSRQGAYSGYTPFSDESGDEQEIEDHVLLMSETNETLKKYTLKDGAKRILYHASLANILLGEIRMSAEYLLQLGNGGESPLVDVERASTKRNMSQLVKRIQRILTHGISDVAEAGTLNEEPTAG